MAKVPQVVRDYVDDQGVGGTIERHDPADLMFNGMICVPGHDHDLSESNILVHTINLDEIGDVSFMGGPNCTFYEKTDPDLPAYVIGSWYVDDGPEYWWAEF